MNITEMSVEQMLAITEPVKIQTGEKVTGKEYLNRFIHEFELNPCDYYTAFYLLKKMAFGEDIKESIKEIREFWNRIED